MSLNPLAQTANESIRRDCPALAGMLSRLGRACFFPKGILSQSAEAKQQADRYNATIGTATEGGQAMHLACIDECFADDLSPDELYPYAPSQGLPALRQAWRERQQSQTPSLARATTSLPVVTNALTHGLSLVGELFLDPGDEVLLPDKLWGNYRLTFAVRREARLSTFPFFDDQLRGFDVGAFEQALQERVGNKLMVILNFPNNPTGYALSRTEAQGVVAALTRAAEAGTRIIAVCDDAYYGMFYDDDCETESLFGPLASAHENILAVKCDGATKEMFVWGLRVGFLTYATRNGTEAAYTALEQKTAGAIRAGISNVTRPGQAVVLRALRHPAFNEQVAAKVACLSERCAAVAQAVRDPQYADCWDVYPFNAGYFMCLRLKEVDAEQLRLHLLAEHGLGTISLGATDLRIAFSCLECDAIPDVFARIAAGVRALR
ncbi:MAG: aminotransferase class I/II-fold pyridoxal phosphate-dependent enzyme [Planctomycetota bacterium]